MVNTTTQNKLAIMENAAAGMLAEGKENKK